MKMITLNMLFKRRCFFFLYLYLSSRSTELRERIVNGELMRECIGIQTLLNEREGSFWIASSVLLNAALLRSDLGGLEFREFTED